VVQLTDPSLGVWGDTTSYRMLMRAYWGNTSTALSANVLKRDFGPWPEGYGEVGELHQPAWGSRRAILFYDWWRTPGEAKRNDGTASRNAGELLARANEGDLLLAYLEFE
jgi:hypothetical protein